MSNRISKVSWKQREAFRVCNNELLGRCLRVLERQELMSTEMFAHGAQAENEGR